MIRLPTLTTSGWLDSPNAKLKKIFTYFIVSEKSRSFFFRNFMETFKDTVSKDLDEGDMNTHLEDSITTMLRNYFSKVEVTVTKEITGKHFSYLFDITVYVSEEEFKIKKSVNTYNGVLEPIINIYRG